MASTTLCDHEWSYVEVRNEMWNRCAKCGLGELWAAGSLISSSDWTESERLRVIEEVEARLAALSPEEKKFLKEAWDG